MGVTKTDLFSDVQNEMALAAKAFAHPARVAIIHELCLAQATISQHLKELKDIGIIQGSIEGSRVNYCINPIRWAEIKDQFTEIFNQFEHRKPGEC